MLIRRGTPCERPWTARSADPERDVADLALAGDLQPVPDVRHRLLAIERPDVPAERDALVQLRQLGVREQRPQLRLSHQDDAQELLGGGLEVRKQAEMLQDLHRQRLRLVHDDHRPAAGLALGEQVAVQVVDELLLAGAARRQPELGVDRLEQLERRERRVDDVGHARLGCELAEEVPQHGRLAGADVAGDADEAARLRQAEAQMRQGVGVLARQKEIARVRRQPEGRIHQPEEPLVHPRRKRPTIDSRGPPPRARLTWFPARPPQMPGR